MQIPGPASPPSGQPTQEITDFLGRLHATGQHIIPGSLLWLPHPTKPGWWVPAVRVETKPKERNNETN